jgi:hypothetical protein
VSGDPLGPAYYAAPRLIRRPRAREWWTLLHPPYTLWHLAYVVVGAAVAPVFSVSRLLATLLAFFAAVGLTAHALDELHDRPLRTSIPNSHLVAVAVAGLVAAVALGVVGVVEVSGYLAIFIVVGVAIDLAYNLELWNGRLHHDLVFAVGWGGFPTVVAGFAQDGRLSVPIALAAVTTTLLASAQRQLSTPARHLRRRTVAVEGTTTDAFGVGTPISRATLLAPLEGALRTLSWMVCAAAVTLVAFRLGW